MKRHRGYGESLVELELCSVLVHEIYLMDKVKSSAHGTSLFFDFGDNIVAELLGNILAVLQWNTEAIILGHLGNLATILRGDLNILDLISSSEVYRVKYFR